MSNLIIHNIVASGLINPINLESVSKSDKIILDENQENAIAFKLKELEKLNPNIIFMLFENGKYIISGAISEKELETINEILLKFFTNF